MVSTTQCHVGKLVPCGTLEVSGTDSASYIYEVIKTPANYVCGVFTLSVRP